jgi:DnaJ-class molecular chaperone
MSVVLFMFTLFGAITASIRQRMAAHARDCTNCHGFGIQRCRLCGGNGAVGWEGKWQHKEPCPMCLGKRYMNCESCGGHYHRKIFRHYQNSGLTAMETLESYDPATDKLGD